MACTVSLSDLPTEVLHTIFQYLDTPDLLQSSRTCHSLRALALDPLLHRFRRQRASHDLARTLSQRPPRSTISPPNAWIYLSRTNVLSRSISRSLVRIRLSHNLGQRPSIDDLIARAVLPAASIKRTISPIILCRGEDVRKSKLRDRLCGMLERRPSIERIVELNIIPRECAVPHAKTKVSPQLVELRRRVMKEALKDGLRAWVERRGISEQKRREELLEEQEGRRSVKALVRRITARNKSWDDVAGSPDSITLEKRRAQARWGREAEMARRKEKRSSGTYDGFDVCSQPTRAHVLGLKRFWESVIKTASI